MREVRLSQGKVALVDDEDFERVNQFKWHYNGGYAVRNTRSGPETKRHKVFLHKFIMFALPGFEVDHKDTDPLNCRKSNLRPATRLQNARNKKKPRNNTSGFKGVQKHNNRWRARLRMKGTLLSLGTYDTSEQAALAYNNAALTYFGEFAHLNTIGETV